MFVILAIVTVCVTIVCTYFLLNAEDYRWSVFVFFKKKTTFFATLWVILLFVCFCRQWTSFLSAGSTALYVYLYSFYYFFFKTK